MALTNKQIEGLKPRSKPYKVHDGRGLFVQVLPSGTKSYILRTNGRERRLGRFPALTLNDARTLAGAGKELPTFGAVAKDT